MTLSKQQSVLLKSFLAGAVFGLIIIFGYQWLGEGHAPVEFKQASRGESEVLRRTSNNPPGFTFSYASAVETAAPAVVNINTAKMVEQSPDVHKDIFRRFFGDEFPPSRQLETSLGSGVIVSQQGYILTNNHVIAEADEIRVGLHDGRSVEAQVVGTDPESDLAVLKVELKDLPVITMGHSEDLRVGDVVLAIGNPYGVGQTVTMGIVSATGRDRLGINVFENFIQTDAAINPGNSGGALVNARGHLVGINTAIVSDTGGSQGIGFAIPIGIAKDVTEQIIEQGHVVRGWLGIEVQDITPALAESFGMSSEIGVIVAGVLRDGPGQKAGLKPGDVIMEINDKPVHDGREAVNRIARATPGTTVELTVKRGDKTVTLNAKTGERPPPERQ